MERSLEMSQGIFWPITEPQSYQMELMETMQPFKVMSQVILQEMPTPLPLFHQLSQLV